MNILSRYIIKEHIPPFFFALAVLMFIFLMNFLVKYITQIFGKGLSLFTIIELIFYNLAWMFALAVPMSVLIATLMSFGRLSADNEITILKSSGISIYRIIRPALWFAITITILMILFNDRVLPNFNHRARVMFRNIREKRPTLKLEQGIFYTVGKYSFMVEKIDKTIGEELSERTNILGPDLEEEQKPDKLLNVLIFDRSNSQKTVTITAKEGYMVYSTARKSLIFSLFEGEYHEFDNQITEDYRFSHFYRQEVMINAPEFELEERDDDYRGDREMNVEMMLNKVKEVSFQKNNELTKISERLQKDWSKISEKIAELESINTKYSKDTTAQSLISDKNWKKALDKARRKITRTNQQTKTSISRINSYSTTINKYLVEVHKKFSIAFSAIIFILIGAPLGISARKGSLGVGATLSIFFFLIYWVGLILGEDLADRRLFTPMLAMWLPNILIGVAGFLLTWRAVKESNIIKFEKWEKFIKVIQRKSKRQKTISM
ncbi:LptF/LptG family permease [Calditrichota bacterium]